MCGGSKGSAPAPTPAPVPRGDPSAAYKAQADADAAIQRQQAATVLSSTASQDPQAFGAELGGQQSFRG